MSDYGAGLQAGGVLSLVLIFLTLVVLVVAASRTKTLRSFQTEMLVFAVVLFAAEVPQNLGTLGVVNLTSILEIGEVLHAASMTVLVVFVAYRIYGFMKPR